MDEAGKQAGVLRIFADGVMVDEVAAAAAKDFANRGRRKVAQARSRVFRAQLVENIFRRSESSAGKWVDEKRRFFSVAADEEVPGKADRREFEIAALGNKKVDDRSEEHTSELQSRGH